jgi:hypothetical protein
LPITVAGLRLSNREVWRGGVAPSQVLENTGKQMSGRGRFPA